MIRVSIIGATGYAGAELLRLLYNHPQVQVVHITSESYTGKKISEVYPHLRAARWHRLRVREHIAQEARSVPYGPFGERPRRGAAR